MRTIYKIGNSESLNSSQAVLLIEVGETYGCFAIVDHANKMIVQSCYYTCDENDNGEILKKILEEHKELNQSFFQIAVCYATPENIMVPSKFFKFEEAKNLLSAMYEKGHNVTVSESIAGWQLNNVYQVPVITHGLLSRHFATGNFWHIYSILLKNKIEHNDAGNFIIDFKTDSFALVVVKNNSLLLAQIFSYSTPQDILYWLLKVCAEFSLSQQEVQLVISGLVDKRSAVFKELYQYFINIEFAATDNDIKLSGDFENYPAHFFSSFYKLVACVS